MEGIVSNVVPAGYAFLTVKDFDAQVFCGPADMPADSIGRKYLLLGESVSFELGSNEKGKVAKNIKLLSPRPPVNIDIATHREIGTVLIVHRGDHTCMLKRHGGGLAYLTIRDVREFPAGQRSFQLGQIFEYNIKQRCTTDKRNEWLAINADAFVPKSESKRSLTEISEENWAEFVNESIAT